MTNDQLKECREAFEKYWVDDRDLSEYETAWKDWKAAWFAHLPNPQPVVSREAIERAFDLGVSLDSDSQWPGYKRTLICNQIEALQLPAPQVPQIDGVTLTDEETDRLNMEIGRYDPKIVRDGGQFIEMVYSRKNGKWIDVEIAEYYQNLARKLAAIKVSRQ